MSSWWFDHTEPPRTTVMKGGVKQDYRANHCDERGSRTTGQVRVSSGWFDRTEPPRTTVMKEGGSRATGQVRVRSGWFDHTEPPVLGGSTTLTHCASS